MKGLVNCMSLVALLLATMCTLACTRTVSKHVNADGVPEEVVFPQLKEAQNTAGIYPNEVNLHKIKPGMTKQDLYYLLGEPHFQEMFGAREWDYIFKFHEDDREEDKICQFKVIFDQKKIARSFYWQPSACGEGFYQTK